MQDFETSSRVSAFFQRQKDRQLSRQHEVDTHEHVVKRIWQWPFSQVVLRVFLGVTIGTTATSAAINMGRSQGNMTDITIGNEELRPGRQEAIVNLQNFFLEAAEHEAIKSSQYIAVTFYYHNPLTDSHRTIEVELFQEENGRYRIITTPPHGLLSLRQSTDTNRRRSEAGKRAEELGETVSLAEFGVRLEQYIKPDLEWEFNTASLFLSPSREILDRLPSEVWSEGLTTYAESIANSQGMSLMGHQSNDLRFGVTLSLDDEKKVGDMLVSTELEDPLGYFTHLGITQDMATLTFPTGHEIRESPISNPYVQEIIEPLAEWRNSVIEVWRDPSP